MSFFLVTSLILLVSTGTVSLFAYRRKLKMAELEMQLDEEKRKRRLSEIGTENLLKYAADAKELKEVQDEDYIAFKEAKDKHAAINIVLDKFYSRKL